MTVMADSIGFTQDIWYSNHLIAIDIWVSRQDEFLMHTLKYEFFKGILLFLACPCFQGCKLFGGLVMYSNA